MSDWHSILTKVVNREKAFLMNNREFRVEFSDPSYVMNVQNNSYNVYGATHTEEDPFVTLYKETAEKLSDREFDDLEGFVENRISYVANQALLANDVVVLQSLFRIIDRCQEIKDSRDLGSNFLNIFFNPATVHTFEEKTRKETKLLFLEKEFKYSEEIENVEIEDEHHSYGTSESSIFQILPGTYTLKASTERGEQKVEITADKYTRVSF